MLVSTRSVGAFWRSCRPQLLTAFGVLTIIAAMQPGIAAAQDLPKPFVSADQARAIFEDAGYQVDQMKTWSWLTPPVSTFQVHDLDRNRVLLVQVYRGIAQAQRASQRPVDGYSASTWVDNLALFEANADDYQRMTA